ncbi:MAG: DUF2318 domain-containing protein [archaeon]
MNKKVMIGVAVIVVVLIVVVIMSREGLTGNTVASVDAQVIDTGDSFKIPLNDIGKDAQWFDYNSNGVNIKYFAVRADDGTVKVAFDACDVCGGSKGYRQEGGDMVCNNCGNHYPISGIGTQNLKGGCWPSYLANTINGDYLIVKKSDLDKGSFRF